MKAYVDYIKELRLSLQDVENGTLKSMCCGGLLLVKSAVFVFGVK
jgi:hypothetical protein